MTQDQACYARVACSQAAPTASHALRFVGRGRGDFDRIAAFQSLHHTTEGNFGGSVGMFRSSTALLGLFCALSISTFDAARAEPAPIPKAPDVTARAYILSDYQSGRVLAQDHADDRMEPASLTKLMTAYV